MVVALLHTIGVSQFHAGGGFPTAAHSSATFAHILALTGDDCVNLACIETLIGQARSEKLDIPNLSVEVTGAIELANNS